VDVLVYGKMEDDARFAVPKPSIQSTYFVDPASECAASETNVLLNNPFKYGEDTLGMYFGENILSVRAMLQRFSFHATVILEETYRGRIHLNIPMRGIFRGPSGAANPGITSTGTAPQTVGGSPYNLVYTTPLQYWSSAYIGMRGSTRWKFAQQTSGIGVHQASWTHDDASFPTFGYYEYVDTADGDDGALWIAYGHASGAQLEDSQDPVEVEVPFYTHAKFLNCRNTRVYGYSPWVSYDALGITTASNRVDCVHIWTAVGDDFSLLGYVGPPRMFIGNLPPRG
jgi:hypothetical protein